jgi:hypothetical protein
MSGLFLFAVLTWGEPHNPAPSEVERVRRPSPTPRFIHNGFGNIDLPVELCENPPRMAAAVGNQQHTRGDGRLGCRAGRRPAGGLWSENKSR